MLVVSSFVGCPAPVAAEVFSLAWSLGVGVCAVRPSARSFSGWVCVSSFSSQSAALRFAAVAGVRFFGAADTYFAVRRFGRRWRVSVPVAVSAVVVVRPASRLRFGRGRLVLAG
ncbi:hypothetical protein [Brunnivagina elsteri]|uniref:Uncharacterized protein n=1 Tax=Brunnivagina elsteri CCALA 953 TaxID=987040 RepID=A0A2A2TLV7_9CYAN|nr:hypothetical protein [Calothrix elsteri]PAX59426.1 hypothetical protein CK510_06980 [Calothrix elsteri CCALA 953]